MFLLEISTKTNPKSHEKPANQTKKINFTTDSMLFCTFSRHSKDMPKTVATAKEQISLKHLFSSLLLCVCFENCPSVLPVGH